VEIRVEIFVGKASRQRHCWCLASTKQEFVGRELQNMGRELQNMGRELQNKQPSAEADRLPIFAWLTYTSGDGS
jgi:hypothetical protein